MDILVQGRASVRDDDRVEIPIAELARGPGYAHIGYNPGDDDRIDAEHAQRLVELGRVDVPAGTLFGLGALGGLTSRG